MARRWNRAATTGANGKAKTENGNGNATGTEIASPHRPVTANRGTSAGGTHSLERKQNGDRRHALLGGERDDDRGGTHCLERKRNGRRETDGTMGGEGSGTNPTTGEVVESNESSVTTRIDRTMRLAVSKIANPTALPASEAKAGKEITYSISVRNAGNITTDITATDSMAEIGTVTMSKSRLAPNETATATVRHAITDAEINAGIVTNTVTVDGAMPDGSMTTSGRATAKTTIEKPAPKLTLEKTVDRKQLTGSEAKAGAELTYSFEIANTGNIAINDIAIDDDLHGL